jgi:AcrR family transcriptional regulator
MEVMMPPKTIVSKEAILEVAFQLTREHGFQSVNARVIAKQLGCSTHPIFRAYANMTELKEDLFRYIENFYNQFMESRMSGSNLFLSIGLAYIQFARKESNLFQMIFMTHNFELKDFMDLINQEDNREIIRAIALSSALDEERAKKLYLHVWLYTHGIASMVSMNNVRLSDEQIEGMLKDAYIAFKNKENER